MVSIKQLREMALALPEATESPHFERNSFRVKNKVFATCSEEKQECVVKLTLADQTTLLGSGSDRYYAVGWAHQGWIGVSLPLIDPASMQELLESAWVNVAPKTLLKQYIK